MLGFLTPSLKLPFPATCCVSTMCLTSSDAMAFFLLSSILNLWAAAEMYRLPVWGFWFPELVKLSLSTGGKKFLGEKGHECKVVKKACCWVTRWPFRVAISEENCGWGPAVFCCHCCLQLVRPKDQVLQQGEFMAPISSTQNELLGPRQWVWVGSHHCYRIHNKKHLQVETLFWPRVWITVHDGKKQREAAGCYNDSASLSRVGKKMKQETGAGYHPQDHL